MRLFSQYCRNLEYAAAIADAPAVPLDSGDIGRVHSFEGCLLVMVGVELGDGVASRVSAAAKAINRICRNTQVAPKLVVLNAFAGLADRHMRADPAEAVEVVAGLAARLTARGHDVHVMPFGWNKQWSASVAPGVWEQRVVELKLAADRREPGAH